MTGPRRRTLREQIELDRAEVESWPKSVRDLYARELRRALRQPIEDRRGEMY